MEFISIPLVVGIITLGIYKLFELFVCKKERITIIEKLSDKFNTSDICKNLSFNLNYSKSNISFSALKGGLLMVGIGFGLLVGFFICYNTFPMLKLDSELGWKVDRQIQIVYGACVLLFGGFGLFSAFLIEMRIGKNKEKDNTK